MMGEDPPELPILAYPNAIKLLNIQLRSLEARQEKAQLSFDVIKNKIEPRQKIIDELTSVIKVLEIVEKEP